MIQQTAIHLWIMWSNFLPVLRDVACARRLISLYFHNKSTMFLFLLCIMCASPLIPSVAAMKAGDSAPASIGGAIMDTLTVAGEMITTVLQNTPTSVAHVRGTDDEVEFEAALQQQNDDRASELPVHKKRNYSGDDDFATPVPTNFQEQKQSHFANVRSTHQHADADDIQAANHLLQLFVSQPEDGNGVKDTTFFVGKRFPCTLEEMWDLIQHYAQLNGHNV